jgi:hypothetical protein
METIHNITNAASGAIWGQEADPNNPNATTPRTTNTGTTGTTSDQNTTGLSTTDPAYTTGNSGYSGQEPISGQLGNTKAGEPYDRGNVGECIS